MSDVSQYGAVNQHASNGIMLFLQFN